MNIESFNIDAGSGPLTITLPESGRIEGVIDGGSGPITLILPDSLEAKITLDGGSGSFLPSSQFSKSRSDGDNNDLAVWVSDGYQEADNYIELEIDQGSGSIRIE